jgi:membrane protease YdiL (CAAX protease family)
MVTQKNTRRILIFITIAFGIPWIALLVIYLTVRAENLVKVGAIVGIFLGITPALANVAARLITKEGWKNLWLRPNFRHGWRFYLAACLLPLLTVIAGGGIFFLLFPQSFDPNLGQVRETLASRPFLATSPWVGILVTTLQTMLIGVALGLIYFGEEFGWRAYLLPKLVERFTGAEPGSVPAEDTVQPAHQAISDRVNAGERKAALLVGVIWGVWHWPGQFLSMKLDPTLPLLFPLVFLVSTCSLSVLLCWVTLRSGSVWPASLGHGVINQIPVLPQSLMRGRANLLLGPGTSGMIGGLGYIALALVLLFSRGFFTREEQRVGSEMAQAVAITHHGEK